MGLYGCFRVDMIPRRWLILGARLVSLGGLFRPENPTPQGPKREPMDLASAESRTCVVPEVFPMYLWNTTKPAGFTLKSLWRS